TIFIQCVPFVVDLKGTFKLDVYVQPTVLPPLAVARQFFLRSNNVLKKPSSHQGGSSHKPNTRKQKALKAGINVRAFLNARTMIARPFPPHFPRPFPCLVATGDGTESEYGFSWKKKHSALSKLSDSVTVK